jgi:hypothetical protein
MRDQSMRDRSMRIYINEYEGLSDSGDRENE